MNHALSVRATDNAPDPCRGGGAGYVTTYQGIAAAPDLHLAEFRRYRTLLVVDEVHHLPALSDVEPGPGPGLGRGSVRVRGSPALPVLSLRCHAACRTRARRSWKPARPYMVRFSILSLLIWPSAGWPTETTRPALFTALRTGFADALLREAFDATRRLRANRRAGRSRAPGEAGRGLGKLLVVAPDQQAARAYADIIRGWVPAGQAATCSGPQSSGAGIAIIGRPCSRSLQQG